MNIRRIVVLSLSIGVLLAAAQADAQGWKKFKSKMKDIGGTVVNGMTLGGEDVDPGMVLATPDEQPVSIDGFDPSRYKHIAVLVHNESGIRLSGNGNLKRVSTVFMNALMEKGYSPKVRDDASLANVLKEVKRQSSPLTGEQKAELGKFKNISAILFVEITALQDQSIVKEERVYENGISRTKRVIYRESRVELIPSIVEIETAEYVWGMNPQVGRSLTKNGKGFDSTVVTELAKHIANNKIPSIRTQAVVAAEPQIAPPSTRVDASSVHGEPEHEVSDKGKYLQVKIAHETTLRAISKDFKYPLAPLADYNSLELDAVLHPGDRVFVPK